MKIGFDAKRLFQNYTGLGSYSRNIVESLQKIFPENEYHLYTPKAVRNTDTEVFFDKTKFVIHESKASFKSYWRSFSILQDLKRDKIDVFHGLSAELPFGIKKSGIKSVVTIHDLIFKYFPRDYKLIDRIIYNFKSKYACQNANEIVSISEYTYRDIQRTYGIEKEKITVVYLPVNNRFSEGIKKENLLELKSRFNLPEKYFLYVGSVNGRKNLKLIIEAMALIKEEERIPLVVVGSGKKYLEETKILIQQKSLIDDIIFLKNISNEDLPKIYKLCSFFVFPSVYEGFGLPVLEAIQSGKLVMVSEDTSLVEVTGNCGLVLPQNDILKWSDAILQQSKQVSKVNCKEHLNNFSSEVILRQLMGVYKR